MNNAISDIYMANELYPYEEVEKRGAKQRELLPAEGQKSLPKSPYFWMKMTKNKKKSILSLNGEHISEKPTQGDKKKEKKEVKSVPFCPLAKMNQNQQLGCIHM